ncbi:hypothetical protein HZU75_04115 [Chitinibacter fontanus]|uniref:Uncharacterized protein n=1 Tax=Chitinibacter fontanus TaxID=1737446 RepID=A0A7D5V8K6_9NEIS|nr:hypothetical protein [Chitinibacter fontanus]QLI80776.1 hypothetical protein HZU75_04115 [Chitinibacter fontanus]
MFNLIPEKYRLAAGVLVLLAVFSLGLWVGWVGASNSKDAAMLKVEHKTAAKVEKKQASAAVAAVANASAIERTRVIYKTVTKEVVRYAQSENAAESKASGVCDQRLDAEWVRIHDFAAVPDDAASTPDESAQPVGKADALGVIARNYETCQQWRNELIGWQSWWRSQAD